MSEKQVWTVVVFHRSNECEGYSDCGSDVEFIPCTSEEAVTEAISAVNYSDKYDDDGEYSWYLFQGKELNGKSDWLPEETGGLDLYAIVAESEVRVAAQRKEVIEAKARKQEEQRLKKEAQAKESERRKQKILEADEKSKLDQLLRKHGLPQWAKEILDD